MWAYAIVRPDVHFTLRALPQVDFAKPPLPSTAVRILPGVFVCSPGDFAMRFFFSPIPCLCRPQSNPCSPTRCSLSSRRYLSPTHTHKCALCAPSRPQSTVRLSGLLPPQVRGELDGVASFEGYLPRGNSLVDLSTRPSNDRCFMYLPMPISVAHTSKAHANPKLLVPIQFRQSSPGRRATDRASGQQVRCGHTFRFTFGG